MPETGPCPLCQTTTCKIYYCGQINQFKEIDCQVCGKYRLSNHAEGAISRRKNSLYIISGVIRNYSNSHEDAIFELRGAIIDDDVKFQAEFLSKAPKNVSEKTSLLLQYISRKSKHPGSKIEISLSKDYPVCFCKNAQELKFFIDHLEEIRAIDSDFALDGIGSVSLTAEGWHIVENMNKPNLESKQAFVAMWFDKQMDEPFEKGILPLEDENETGFKMLRIDQKHFNDKICDHIIAEIKQSRFMIADCTELRSAVFFEAGYAMGMGLPVIFTCKEGTEIKKCFDTDHYNHIVWKDAEDLKNKLKDRILATIGKAR